MTKIYEYNGKFYTSINKVYEIILGKSGLKKPMTTADNKVINKYLNSRLSNRVKTGFLFVVAAELLNPTTERYTYTDGSVVLHHKLQK